MDCILSTIQVCFSQPGQQPSPPVRALCDTGSQVNLITMDSVQRIGLAHSSSSISIMGVGESTSLRANGYVDAEIMRVNHINPALTIRLVIVSKITTPMPATTQEKHFSGVLRDDELGDPLYWTPGRIDVLLGIGVWNQIIENGIFRERKGNCTALAQKTSFGWTISTHHDDLHLNDRKSLHVKSSGLPEDEQLAQLDQSIRRFWEIESIPGETGLSKNDQLAVDIFENTHKRELSGRYTVMIPFKTGGPILGNSRNMALRQLLRLEERISTQPELKKFYDDFFLDYINKGHMIQAPPAPQDSRFSYYTPYHLVKGSKPRVVFNSSCQTDTGVSLNDLQLPGPRLQDELSMIFMRFRMHRYGVAADIEKMFRQVNVHSDHWNYQRILWRPDKNGPIREYYITVVVWGMTSATFNAVSALRQCAKDQAKDAPKAAESALDNFYIDDHLDGADTPEELIEHCSGMAELTSAGGFNLAKWVSNCMQLLQLLGIQHTDIKTIMPDTGVLGMLWKVTEDMICLKTNIDVDKVIKKPTKADIVSAISKVYDPTGLFAPAILVGKLIMQDFWRQPEIGWKDPAPDHLVARFHQYHHQIPELTKIATPRWLGCTKRDRVECHLFCDSSMKAYGAAAYIRVLCEDGTFKSSLLTSRSRVAPLKEQTIPRLELLGARLAAQLAKYVKEALKRPEMPIYCWTDSTIVLHWLRKESSKLSPFVAARVAQILEATTVESWRHVSTTENPADILSRSQSPDELRTNALWWNGPVWLALDESRWPTQIPLKLSTIEEQHTAKETRRTPVRVTAAVISQPTKVIIGALPPGPPASDELTVCNKQQQFESLLKRRSTINGLLRVTAYVMRFVTIMKQILKKEKTRPSSILSPLPKLQHATIVEKEAALLIWIRIAQRSSFGKEIEALVEQRPLPRQSTILKLTPIWRDQDSTLRLTGRLSHSDLSYDEMHPIILPSQHDLVNLIILDAHTKTNHGGPQLCIALLRQRFWIPKIRISIRRYIGRRCVSCIRHSKITAQQLMGDLPAVRTTIAPCFSRVGVDFAGPFTLRKTAATTIALRKAVSQIPKAPTTIKGYVVIFVDLVSRAVHLDVMTGLHTEAFLECFARMTARRGPCVEIWSDNGTSFVGANKELARVISDWENRFPDQQLADMGTQWKFITPLSPFKGGIWEAAVKTFKHHLYRVLGARMLTCDQMYTLVVQIEASMNARPLFPQSDDPTDLNPITPAHLVIGRSTLQRPLAEDVQQIVDNRLTLWGLQQKLFQQFWASWKNDYISRLQVRNKWYNIEKNLKEGDMVLIHGENTPPSRWPLGRVLSVVTSSDGLVRTAKISIATIRKNSNGNLEQGTTTFDRPVQKLCILLPDDITPINESMPD